MGGDDSVLDRSKGFNFADLINGRARPVLPEGAQAQELPAPAGCEAEAAEANASAGEMEFDPLPKAGDAYKAHARVSNKPELMLGLLLTSVPLDAFAYGDLRRVRLLEPQVPGGGPVLCLRFMEAEISDVLIEGRNLLTLTDYLQMHRIRWLRECPKGKEPKDPAAPVITRIEVRTQGE